ncbi:MAG: two-component sensor histidine kinase [Alphaproteobacteria bacterium]|nr:two-component sensor histidine kinase [Alphaproteobacteria bacterium]
MRITFPHQIEDNLRAFKRRLLPKTLFFRTMLLIIVPLIVVQIVSIVAYFHGSWGKVGRRLSDNLSSNMAFVVEVCENNPSRFEEIRQLAKRFYDLDVEFSDNTSKHQFINEVQNSKIVTGFFENSLKKEFAGFETTLYLEGERTLVALVSTKNGFYRFSTATKNIFNSSLFGFIAWMIGTSLLLFIVSSLFLRVQARSIKQLAEAAENFGKGIDTPFKPYGSAEVRTAGLAFTKMKERIKVQMSERTQMLAGVSHDLRTPLTRMKLALAMDKQTEENKAFLEDVTEMEKMLDGYLSFVRGENREENAFVDMNLLIKSVASKFDGSQHRIKCFTQDEDVVLQGREQALRRMLTNLVSNACYYAKNIAITLKTAGNMLLLYVEDDGPGIPEDKREDVFKAFYRIEGSRNKQTGGVGLGLSITKDIVVSHGGTIKLSQSTMGGLKVEIKIPL